MRRQDKLKNIEKINRRLQERFNAENLIIQENEEIWNVVADILHRTGANRNNILSAGKILMHFIDNSSPEVSKIIEELKNKHNLDLAKLANYFIGDIDNITKILKDYETKSGNYEKTR